MVHSLLLRHYPISVIAFDKRVQTARNEHTSIVIDFVYARAVQSDWVDVHANWFLVNKFIEALKMKNSNMPKYTKKLFHKYSKKLSWREKSS